jgi:hypothetical protein
MLTSGGKIQVIDMDMKKAIDDWQINNSRNLPIELGTSDWKFCMHVSGYSTRLSLFTYIVLWRLLGEAGFDFHETKQLDSSEYDSRPLESLIVETIR